MGIWYRAGTVSVNNGAATVTGVGTLALANIKPGDAMVIGNFAPVEILSVQENTEWTLAENWPNANQSAQPYYIIPGPGWGDASNLSVQVQALINAFSGQLSGIATNKGNLPVGDASAFQALAVGANNAILRANSAAALGLDWISFAALLANAQHAPATVASAATTDIGAASSDRVDVTGNATITSLGTSVSRLRFVRFTGTPILTHNGTSLILPGAANINVTAGDCATFSADASGNWTCLDYHRANGGVPNTALNALAGLTPAADRLPYYTGASAAALATFTAFARTLLDDPDAATMRATIAALGTAGGTLTGPITWGLANGDMDALMGSSAGLQFHRVQTGATNTPSGATVNGAHVASFVWDVNAARQVYLDLASARAWTRRKSGGTVYPWVEIVTFDNIGTSGAKIPLLNTANTWSAAQTLSAALDLASGQINFPAAQNASSGANVLDDYEEGSWTPVLQGGTSTGSGTYSFQAGAYVKIGKMVMVTFNLAWSAHTGTGQMRIAGLPFTPTMDGVAALRLANITYTNAIVQGVIGTTLTRIDLENPASNSNASLDMDTAGNIIGTAVYVAA